MGRWLEAARIQAVIVGGVAASFLGRPRFTQDIDALAILAEQEWQAALAAAPAYGLVPRIENPLDFARRTRVLHMVGGISVRLPRVEDLLIMKAVAHRPQDLQDIEGLLDAHPEADIDSVRRWVREFAAATAMSDLIEDFERLVARRAADNGR